MSSRPSSALYASAASPIHESYAPSEGLGYNDDVPSPSHRPSRAAWVDPASLSNYGDVSSISGNVSSHVKQLILNTYMAYGAGDENCFGHAIAKAVKFVNVNVSRSEEKNGRMEATTVAEVTVTKNMLNGAGMLHGGCVAFLIDKYVGLDLLEYRITYVLTQLLQHAVGCSGSFAKCQWCRCHSSHERAVSLSCTTVGSSFIYDFVS